MIRPAQILRASWIAFWSFGIGMIAGQVFLFALLMFPKFLGLARELVP
jgi:hypothetical protein